MIAEVWPIRMANDGCIRAIHDHIAIERERDIAQDARFGIRQLADIALRALSPAINDPTTGILCIKYLQAVFERLMYHLPFPDTYRFANGTSSLDIRQPTFEEFLEVYAEIGHYAGGNLRVLNTLLTSLERVKEIAIFLKKEEYQDILVSLRTSLAAIDTTEYPSYSKDDVTL